MRFAPLWPPVLTPKSKENTRARLGRWKCYACGHEWRAEAPPPYCRECGQRGAYVFEDLCLKGSRSEEVAPLRPGTPVPEWSIALPQGLPLGTSLIVRGRPGAGKSRLAFRLASQIGQTSVLALEMGKSLSVDSARSAGARLDCLWWYDDLSALDELDVLGPRVVVVDSTQKLGRSRSSVVARLRQWALTNDRNLILISQLGKHGTSRYGESDDFDCDIVADVSHGSTPQETRKAIHGFDAEPTPCRQGCAHVSIAKARLCPLVAFDVPIFGG